MRASLSRLRILHSVCTNGSDQPWILPTAFPEAREIIPTIENYGKVEDGQCAFIRTRYFRADPGAAGGGPGRVICSATGTDNTSLTLRLVDSDYSFNTLEMKALVPYQSTQNFPHGPPALGIKEMNPRKVLFCFQHCIKRLPVCVPQPGP